MPDPSRRNRISQKSFSAEEPAPPEDDDEDGREDPPPASEPRRAEARPGELRDAPGLTRESSLSEALLFIADVAVVEEDEASSSSFFPPGRKCVGKLLASEISVSEGGKKRNFMIMLLIRRNVDLEND